MNHLPSRWFTWNVTTFYFSWKCQDFLFFLERIYFRMSATDRNFNILISVSTASSRYYSRTLQQQHQPAGDQNCRCSERNGFLLTLACCWQQTTFHTCWARGLWKGVDISFFFCLLIKTLSINFFSRIICIWLFCQSVWVYDTNCLYIFYAVTSFWGMQYLWFCQQILFHENVNMWWWKCNKQSCTDAKM